jgi:hypothetical protein
MRGLRQTLRAHRQWAMLLVALALAVKALVPAGFMVAPDASVFTVTICADASGEHATQRLVVPHRASPEELGTQHAKSAACPFSALDMAGTAGADPILLALALAFILAIGFAPSTVPELAALRHVRPPLRGPPALA